MKTMKINIFNIPYEIEWKVLDGEGEMFAESALIYINPDYPLEAQKRTLMHEIFHAIELYRLMYVFEAIKDVKDKDTREHLVIDPFATGIYEVLNDNKNLRDYFFPEEREASTEGLNAINPR